MTDNSLVNQIPNIRFRLPHKYGVLPALTCDDMTDGGLLIGQNAASGDVDAIFIGKHAEAGHRNVWMDIRGAHVLYVMGKRRSGKSYTLGGIAEGLVSDTWVNQGSVSPAVLILDTMNVFLTMPFAVEDTLSKTVLTGSLPESGSCGAKELRQFSFLLPAPRCLPASWHSLSRYEPPTWVRRSGAASSTLILSSTP